MHLPFTQAQFLDVFAAYNAALWPAALALWLVSVRCAIVLFRGRAPGARGLSALLAVHWGWSAVAYHACYFTSINRAAWLFATLFFAQAGVVAWLGVFRNRLQFSTGSSWRHRLASALVVYALAYPFVIAAEGFTFPRAPTFGVPCPTTIFTIGLLLTVEPLPWSLTIVPAVWAAVASSAAFLLSVHADLVLLPGALILIVHAALTWGRNSRREGKSSPAAGTFPHASGYPNAPDP